MNAEDAGPRAVRTRALAAVESQLRHRGYDVSPAAPRSAGDFWVRRPGNGAAFPVKVRGLRRPNGWIVNPIPVGSDLCYVLALVPAGGGDRFFVMREAEVLAEIDRQRARLARTPDYIVQGFNFSAGERYEGRWETLPH